MFQDWWNIVVWDRPDLYYNLDCGLNFQLKKEFNKPPFDSVSMLFVCLQVGVIGLLTDGMFHINLSSFSIYREMILPK